MVYIRPFTSKAVFRAILNEFEFAVDCSIYKKEPDSEINATFLSNEHGDPRFFFQVFAKNSLIKNIFEEEKKFDSRT